MTAFPPFPATPATEPVDRRPGRGWLVVGLVLAVATIGVWTGTTVHQQFNNSVQFSEQDRTFSAPVRSVVISVPDGRVTVVGRDTGQVRVVAVTSSTTTLAPQDVEHLRHGVLTLGSACSPGWFASCTVQYRVVMPTGVPLSVTVGTGTVTVTATGSDVTVKTGNGRIGVGRAATVHADTATGTVTVGQADTVSASTGNGNVRVDRIGGSLQINTSTGSVSGAQLALATDKVRVGNGNVTLDFTDNTSATSAGATVTVTAGTGSVTLTVPSGSGPYDVRATPGTGRTSQTVRTDPSSATLISVRTGNGDITIQYAS